MEQLFQLINTIVKHKPMATSIYPSFADYLIMFASTKESQVKIIGLNVVLSTYFD